MEGRGKPGGVGEQWSQGREAVWGARGRASGCSRVAAAAVTADPSCLSTPGRWDIASLCFDKLNDTEASEPGPIVQWETPHPEQQPELLWAAGGVQGRGAACGAEEEAGHLHARG